MQSACKTHSTRAQIERERGGARAARARWKHTRFFPFKNTHIMNCFVAYHHRTFWQFGITFILFVLTIIISFFSACKNSFFWCLTIYHSSHVAYFCWIQSTTQYLEITKKCQLMNIWILRQNSNIWKLYCFRMRLFGVIFKDYAAIVMHLKKRISSKF